MAQILVIEDNDSVRKYVRRTLEMEGHEVIEAIDGAEAMNCLQEESPDIVITDIFMPKKNGFETITEMRDSFPDIKIIAISGGGLIEPEAFLQKSKELGVSQTLAKPFLPHDIQKAVKEVITSGKAISAKLN